MFVSTDLHGHTYYSDGRATPDEYVEFRRALGMKAIAIADHDVLAGVRAGAVACTMRGGPEKRTPTRFDARQTISPS